MKKKIKQTKQKEKEERRKKENPKKAPFTKFSNFLCSRPCI